MKFDVTKLSWVDFALVLVLLIGVVRGRKRGMSEELLDLLKWLASLVVASMFYQPLGDYFEAHSPFSHLFCYVAVYLVTVLLIRLIFSMLKRKVGEKLVGSDLFGSAEYYLGVGAGLVRYACVTLMVLALLNSRLYSPEEIEKSKKTQAENFGTISFPTFAGIQEQVFAKSILGRSIKQHFDSVLIKPTPAEKKGLERSGSVKKREQVIDEVLKPR
ncbi:MAG: hypothetical protein DME26_16760 [Verrucomicrobia bacterium]|nr:MAG: hypothetical protein DME26_16760 [Verrucomicrobiota bacterium]